jgi:hypothetical protein
LGGGGIRKGKERGAFAAGLIQALHQTFELVVEHGLQTLAAAVVLGRTVNAIADGHVVCGNGLGDGARGFAGVEKPTGDLLAGADLGKRAVLAAVEIDLQGFRSRAAGFFRHLLIS